MHDHVITLGRVELVRFKSYCQATLPIAPLTVLIGANASGKSNAIEALRFIREVGTGRYLDDAYKDLHDAGVLRGQREELVWNHGDRFSLESWVAVGEAEMRWRMSVIVQPELVIHSEELAYQNESLRTFWSESKNSSYPHTIAIRYNNFARGGKKPHLWADDRQAIFTQMNTPTAFTTRKAQRIIPKRIEMLRYALNHIHFLEPRPSRMRGYAPIETDVRLSTDGRNLSAVLYDICRHQDKKERLLDFIHALPEGEITDVSFIETERNDVMVRVTEQFGTNKQTWDAAMLSDGTLRVLAIAAALLSVPEGSLVVIEEIDNGVHPARAKMLIQNMQRVIRERSLRTLLTTHNPALLDALPPDSYLDVVYCYRDLQSGDSHLLRLADLPDYPALMMQGSLGALLAQRVLERAVRDMDSQTRKERNLEWLEAWVHSGGME